jgi:uncharacterized protein DUF2877
VEQPVTLTATLVDAALGTPALFRGQVEHAYRAALYVRDLRFGRLAVVAIADVGGVPGGMLVDGVPDLRTLDAERRPLVVDVSSATRWSPRLPAAARFSSRRGLAARVGLARQFATETVDAPAAGRGFGALLASAAAPHIAALRSALITGDARVAEAAAVALIGLGIGLTPSGDDFLVGLLAGLEATHHPARSSLAAAIASEAPSRTTAIGANVLEHAARGEFTARLHDVVIALADDAAAGLDRAVGRAMAYGATSGADTLVGLFLALDVAAGAASDDRGLAA